MFDGRTGFAGPKTTVTDISPLTTKGDIWVYSNINTRLPVGSDGNILVSDSAASSGLSWSSISITYNTSNRNFNFGANNTISAPTGSNYKFVSGINISDGSTRGTITGSRITIYDGLTSMNVNGDNITVGQWMRSMVIVGNDVTASNVSLVSNAGEGVLIGNGISSNNWKQTGTGWFLKMEGVADSGYGWCANTKGTSGNHRIAFGRTATAIIGGSIVLGSHTNNNIWISNGETHKFTNLNGTLENVAPNSRTLIWHIGADAWDQQATPDDFNVAGGPGALAPGVPTGTGSRARLHFYQADGVDLGQNTKQVLQSVGYIDTTGDMVWWDQLRIAKISSTAVCIVGSGVSTGDIAANYALKIANEATSINSKSGTSLLLKIANATRIDITANATTLSNRLELVAGTATISPLKFTAGTNLTTAVTGTMEYNGTNLFFTRTGTTRENIICASAVTTESIVSDTTVTVNISGTTYKLLAAA